MDLESLLKSTRVTYNYNENTRVNIKHNMCIRNYCCI